MKTCAAKITITLPLKQVLAFHPAAIFLYVFCPNKTEPLTSTSKQQSKPPWISPWACQHAPMDDTVDDELVELPRPLTGRDVTLFLDPFGFHASTQMDWQKGALEQIRQMW